MTLETSLALLVTAFLFGGMVLFSFAFAAFLFTHLPAAVQSALNPQDLARDLRLSRMAAGDTLSIPSYKRSRHAGTR